MGELIKKHIPILGGLFGDGAKTSGFTLATGAGAAIWQSDAPGWAKAIARM